MEKRQVSLFQVWFQAIRFPSLTASLIPVMLGGAFAVMDRAFQTVPFLLALLASNLLHAGANLFNDYFDSKTGADAADSLCASGVIQKGWLTPQQVYQGGVVCFVLASLLGAYLVTRVGSGMLWFGLIGLLVGYCYTGGPFPLAYRGLGELAAFVGMGPLLVLATYYAQMGMMRWTVFGGSIPIGLVAAAMLHANNLRDREHDRLVGKITLANLLSEKGAKQELTVLVFAAYAIQILLVSAGTLPKLSLITLLSLPVAVQVIRKAWTSATPLEMNLVVGLTVLLHLVYGTAYALGLFGSVLFLQ
ncbi:1,4-dihydroxy-2-naphthoate octaprenyltransferase [Effusibacillus pohliae]|uniref:1,4-dihydroxy-2-naphthoate octaprenyltransferase n=1 Tax=Effusibacillus pohliae TaxID=232270 RepID=UPI00037FB9E2|nr:1,4-dihydroxy-2-naphthoate octaprenyltransferase [Effusibacillus pohliae]